MTTHESAPLPRISVIVPCRNEAKNIARCLRSIIDNDYPRDLLEVLVVDGMSEDGSRDLASALLRERGVSFFIIDNPERTTPFALNKGIAKSGGDIIGTVGGHNFISPNYLRGVANILLEESAECAGGRGECIPMGEQSMAKAIALVMRSRFGVGGSFRSHTGQRMFVDTVPSPFYKRSVFSRVGVFNEKLTRSQDIELNRRIARSGGRIMLDPDLVSFYYDRPTLWTFIRQKFINGMWSILPFGLADHVPVSLRHLIPLLFVTGLAASAFLSLLFPWMAVPLFLILGSHAMLNAFFSFRIAQEHGLLLFPYLFFLFFVLHVSYGLGSLGGIVLLFARAFYGKR